MVTWTFGLGGAFTAAWDGVMTLTITATSGGGTLGTFSGADMATLSAAQATAAQFAQQAATTNAADLSLYLAPAGATGEAFPRLLATSYLVLVSEQIYVSAIPLQAGLPVASITFRVGAQAASAASVTHGWYALLDSNRVVRAVSADQTGGNWLAAFTDVPLPVAGNYVTTYGGNYGLAICVTGSATMPEFPVGPNTIGGLGGDPAPLCGTIGTASSTTPPALGTQLGAISAVSTDRLYGYTS